MTLSLPALNHLSQAEFTTALGDIFEHSPLIAEQAWLERPFESVTALHEAMVRVVVALPTAEQLSLICAHPDLGTRAKMAEASVQEQAGAGLDRLTPEEYERFQQLNQAYRDRFGFPFILAVRHHTKESILQTFAERLTHDPATERQQALAEIAQIAWIRLSERIQSIVIS
jgi:2-oxo-4-hydroxy-4-carboxy-5-ureidoimidazoline decarboxylase